MEIKKHAIHMESMAPVIEEALRRGDSVRITVTGNSMYPLLHSRRDTVVLSPADRIRKHDITFHRRADGRYILHRVLKVQRDGTYLIAGDNEHKTEPPVRRDQILGVVTEFTRWGRRYSVKHPLYRLYVCLWHLLMPCRGRIVAFRRKHPRQTRGES